MRKKLILLALAAFSTVACHPYHSPFVSNDSQAASDSLGGYGQLRVTIAWPSASSYAVQWIPRRASRAKLIVRAATGDVVASQEVSRQEGAALHARFELPPAAGYTVEATFYDAAGERVAIGESEAFQIERQRVASVDLVVSPVISTFVGAGTEGFSGDEGPAREAHLNQPHGLALDTSGNLLVVDSGNHVIRMVDGQGVIRTIVGTAGEADTGFPVLGGNVAQAEALLNKPYGGAVAPNGDLIIADTTNRAYRVLPITDGERYGYELKQGFVQTILRVSAGGPLFRSVVVDADGTLFVAERHRILMITPQGEQIPLAGLPSFASGAGADGPALTSALYSPDALIMDAAGNLLFTDVGNHRVRMLCREPGTYFGIPMASGSVYTIAGTGNQTSPVTPAGDGGDGLHATFNSPCGLVLDAEGNLFIADTGNHRIRLLSPERKIFSFAGTGEDPVENEVPLGDGGGATRATFSFPMGLLIHQGDLYIADSGNHRVRRIPL